MYLKLTEDYLTAIKHQFPNTRFNIPRDEVLSYIWDLVDTYNIESSKVSLAGGVFWDYTNSDPQYSEYLEKFLKLKDIDVFVPGNAVQQVAVGKIDDIVVNFDYSINDNEFDRFDFYPSMVHMFYRSKDIFFPEELLAGHVIRDNGSCCQCNKARRDMKYMLKGFPIYRDLSQANNICEVCKGTNWAKINL